MFSEIKNFLKASRFLLKCENVVKKLTLWYDVIFKIVGNCGKIIKKLQLYICRMEPKNGSISVMFILGVLTRPISYTIFWNLFWLLNRILHLLFTCCDLNLYSISQLCHLNFGIPCLHQEDWMAVPILDCIDLLQK